MTHSDANLIIEVQFVEWMQRIMPDIVLDHKELNEYGMDYVFVLEGHSSRFAAQIALYESEAIARAAINAQRLMAAVGPSRADRAIGDELFVWRLGDPMAGAVLFRRNNAVCYFTGGLSIEERLSLAEDLDRAFVEGAPELRLASVAEPPRIERVDIPREIPPKATLVGELTVTGIAPEEALFGSASSNAIVAGGAVPTLTYFAPEEPGENTIVLLVSSPGNLMTRKSITVEIK